MAKSKEYSMEELCEKIDALAIPDAPPAEDNPGRAFFIGMKAGLVKSWGQGFVVLDGQQVLTKEPARTVYEFLLDNYSKKKSSSSIFSFGDAENEPEPEPEPEEEEEDIEE